MTRYMRYAHHAITVLTARLRTATYDESGFAPLSMMLALAVIITPVLLLVLTIPTWLERGVDAMPESTPSRTVEHSA